MIQTMVPAPVSASITEFNLPSETAMLIHPLPLLGACLLIVGGLALSSCGDDRSAAAGSPATSPAVSSSTGVIPYPLKTCLVTGNDLGSMGDAQRVVYQGRELKFCCQPCVDKFQRNPQKYLDKLPPN